MFALKIGQVLEFIEPAGADDHVIPKGTRVRVGLIMNEIVEPSITLLVLGEKTQETLTVAKHIVMLHCQPVPEPASGAR